MKILIVGALMLASCGKLPSDERAVDARSQNIELVGIAPDGTHLWLYSGGYGSVYFASSGTSRTVSCGKNCTRDERVPSVVSEHK